MQAFEITKTEVVSTSSGQVWYKYVCMLGHGIENLLFNTSCIQYDTCNKPDTLALQPSLLIQDHQKSETEQRY